MKYCSKCGHQCPDETKFCKSCGHPFIIEGIKDVENPEPELLVTEFPVSEIPNTEMPVEQPMEKEILGNLVLNTDFPIEELPELEDLKDEIAELEEKHIPASKAFTTKTQLKTEKISNVKTFRVVIGIAVFILLLVSILFIFRNNIKQRFDRTSELSKNDMGIPKINADSIKAASSPSEEMEIHSDLEKEVIPSKNIPNKDQVVTPVNPKNKYPTTSNVKFDLVGHSLGSDWKFSDASEIKSLEIIGKNSSENKITYRVEMIIGDDKYRARADIDYMLENNKWIIEGVIGRYFDDFIKTNEY